MAIWHSFSLVGHYRIFRAMNTLTNYHRLEVKPKMELSVSYEIASLKVVLKFGCVRFTCTLIYWVCLRTRTAHCRNTALSNGALIFFFPSF